MNLIDNKNVKSENDKDMEDVINFKKLSFKDFMKKYRKDKKKERNIKEYIDYPKGSSWSSKPAGSNIARKYSYKQPGSGKISIGSQFSSDSAFKKDPSFSIDVKDFKNSLNIQEKQKLENICDNLDISEDDAINIAIKNNWNKETFFAMYALAAKKEKELNKKTK